MQLRVTWNPFRPCLMPFAQAKMFQFFARYEPTLICFSLSRELHLHTCSEGFRGTNQSAIVPTERSESLRGRGFLLILPLISYSGTSDGGSRSTLGETRDPTVVIFVSISVCGPIQCLKSIKRTIVQSTHIPKCGDICLTQKLPGES
jgi:hypothetical protein